jgi:hypothetical protein
MAVLTLEFVQEEYVPDEEMEPWKPPVRKDGRRQPCCAFCGQGCRGDMRVGCECYEDWLPYCRPEARGPGCPNGLLTCAPCSRGER